MSDPLSSVASVASLIALAGTTSKAFYSFLRSIRDAPAIAMDLLSSLYALNTALSQIRENSLHKLFVAAADNGQMEALQICLVRCTTTFEMVKAKVDASGLTVADHRVLRRSWKSVKAYFNESQMQHCLSALESNKTTLLLILTARLDVDMMSQLQEIKMNLKKTSCPFEDTRFSYQRDLDPQNSRAPDRKTLIEIRILPPPIPNKSETPYSLQCSGFVINLGLGGLQGNTTEAVWEAVPVPGVSLQCISSEARNGDLTEDLERNLQFRSHTVPTPSDFREHIQTTRFASVLLMQVQIDLDLWPTKSPSLPFSSCAEVRVDVVMVFINLLACKAKKIATISECLGFKTDRMWPVGSETFNASLDRAATSKTPKSSSESADRLTSDLVEDMEYLVNVPRITRRHWMGIETASEEVWQATYDKYSAAADYLEWVTDLYLSCEGGRKAPNKFTMQLAASANEARRKTLKANMFRSVEKFRDARLNFAIRRSHDTQDERLEFQRKIGQKLTMLLLSQKILLPKMEDQQGACIEEAEHPDELAED